MNSTRTMKGNSLKIIKILFVLAAACSLLASAVSARDLPEVLKNGVLRHLGVPYAHFVIVTADGVKGLDVELMQRFAKHLGVRYQWVETSWTDVFGDLTGHRVQPTSDSDDVRIIGATAVRGDIIANGLTILPWREKVVRYSEPTFPTGVWLIARAASPIKPIRPSGDILTDIRQVKKLLAGHSLLAMKGTCLDPELYGLSSIPIDIRYRSARENLKDIAPAVIQGRAETALLDIPDALVALQRWPGEIKVIGPVSPPQRMGVAVAKSSPRLLSEFNKFFRQLWASGAYDKLVRKYYPSVYLYLGDFFKSKKGD